MSVTAEQARAIAWIAYNLGWGDACNDHIAQDKDREHPIGRSLRDERGLVGSLDPYNVIGLGGGSGEG